MKALVLALALVFVAAASAFAWYYYKGPCGINDVLYAADQMEAKTQEYEDAFSVAASTSRISLSGPIGDLQRIKRETEDIDVPVCLEKSKALSLEGMQGGIDGFLAFMGQQENDSLINKHFMDGAARMKEAVTETEYVAECAPFCKGDSDQTP